PIAGKMGIGPTHPYLVCWWNAHAEAALHGARADAEVRKRRADRGGDQLLFRAHGGLCDVTVQSKRARVLHSSRAGCLRISWHSVDSPRGADDPPAPHA